MISSAGAERQSIQMATRIKIGEYQERNDIKNAIAFSKEYFYDMQEVRSLKFSSLKKNKMVDIRGSVLEN